MKLNTITFLLYFSVLFCFGQKDYDYNVTNIPFSHKKNANSVYLYKNMKVTIHNVNSMTITKDYAITILNPSGEKAGRLYEYDSPERKINKLQAIIYDKNGEKIKKIKEKDFENSLIGSSAQSNRRLKKYVHESGNFPYTIYFHSEIETQNTGFVPSFYFLSQNKQSIVYSKFEILNPTNIPIRKLENQLLEYNVKYIHTKNKHYALEVHNIKAVKSEKNSPSHHKIFPWVKFALDKFNLVNVNGEANDWKSFGKWKYDKLYKGRLVLPKSTIDKISNLTKHSKTDLEKAKIIYQYVQDNTRYTNINLGIGGWQPIVASQVDKLGYGDCKALTNYTKALMDTQNIKSNYAFVSAGNKKVDFPKDFACLMGNHVILNLPNKGNDIWLECTSQTNPFGYIAGFTDDRNVLVVSSEQGGLIKKTKKYTAQESISSLNCTYFFDENNTLKGEYNSTFKGAQFKAHTRRETDSNKKALYHKKFNHLGDLQIENIEFSTNNDEIIGSEFFDFVHHNYAKTAGSRFIFAPNVFNRKQLIDINEDRLSDYEIQRGYSYNDYYEINYNTNKLSVSKTLPESLENKK